MAFKVAAALNIDLDIVVPRKLGAPHNPEFAIGAIAGDVIYLDQEMIKMIGVSKSLFKI